MTVNIVDGSLNDGDNVSQVTFTFSEAPSNFDASDLTVAGGAISGLAATADPKVWTATFAATDNYAGTGSVTVGNAWTDTAGNAGVGNADTVTIDTVNPTVTVNIVDGSLNDGDNVSQVTFTFSEAPSNFDASDLTVVGGAISGLAATADPKVDGDVRRHGQLRRHRFGDGQGNSLDGHGGQRRGRQRRHGDDRHGEPDGDGQYRRWQPERRRTTSRR